MRIVKRGFRLSKNNKGSVSMPLEEIIFIVLNAVFFILLVVFIMRSTHGVAVYEQSYAKQIALTISNSRPNTTIYIGMGEDLNRFDKEKPSEVVRLDKEENKVIATFGRRRGRYFNYFTDANVSLEDADKFLKINIKS